MTIAGLEGANIVKCSRMVSIMPDTSLEEALKKAPYDVIILPGGLQGSELLAKSTLVGEVLKQHENAGCIIAAICAGMINRKSCLSITTYSNIF